MASLKNTKKRRSEGQKTPTRVDTKEFLYRELYKTSGESCLVWLNEVENKNDNGPAKFSRRLFLEHVEDPDFDAGDDPDPWHPCLEHAIKHKCFVEGCPLKRIADRLFRAVVASLTRRERSLFARTRDIQCVYEISRWFWCFHHSPLMKDVSRRPFDGYDAFLGKMCGDFLYEAEHNSSKLCVMQHVFESFFDKRTMERFFAAKNEIACRGIVRMTAPLVGDDAFLFEADKRDFLYDRTVKDEGFMARVVGEDPPLVTELTLEMDSEILAKGNATADLFFRLFPTEVVWVHQNFGTSQDKLFVHEKTLGVIDTIGRLRTLLPSLRIVNVSGNRPLYVHNAIEDVGALLGHVASFTKLERFACELKALPMWHTEHTVLRPGDFGSLAEGFLKKWRGGRLPELSLQGVVGSGFVEHTQSVFWENLSFVRFG